MKKTPFHKRDGKVAREVIDGIRRQHRQGPGRSARFTSLDSVLIGLRQIDLLEEIRDVLRRDREQE